MPPVIVKYPLDKTGVSPGNKVLNEPKVLRQTRTRVICTNYGAFFAESLVITDTSTGLPLVKDVDYYAGWMYQIPTKETGKEVCSLIVITNENVSANVTITYQALGGEYSYAYSAIVDMIAALDLDDRPVEWGNIINKPTTFAPAPHLQDAGDLYGFEYITSALQTLTDTMALGAAASEKQFYTYVDNRLVSINASIAALQQGGVTSDGILAALGFTPVDPANATFTKRALFNAGIELSGPVLEKVVTVNATTSVTTLDLSLGDIFVVNLNVSTTFAFSTANIENLTSGKALSFTLIIVNKAANLAIAFSSPTGWTGKTIPPRTVALNGRDEYYFSTFDTGASYTGSLSNQNVGTQ